MEGVSVTRNLAAHPLCSFSGPDASLAGLDPGELIAIPPLPDSGGRGKFEANRKPFGRNLTHKHSAARYGIQV
jgi:hypothetical protein